nr:Spy/CpxP family protein refolding chaperone [Nitrosomonas nitrosa]
MNSHKSTASIVLGTMLTISLLLTPMQLIAADHKKEAHAHGSMMRHDHDHSHSYAQMVASHAEALQLTNEQLGKVVRLHMKGEKAHKKLKQKMHKSHHAFKEASMKPSTDEAALDKLAKEHAADHQAMIDHHINERKVVHEILTPEQLSQLKTMKMHHGKHGHDHGSSKHDQQGNAEHDHGGEGKKRQNQHDGH